MIFAADTPELQCGVILDGVIYTRSTILGETTTDILPVADMPHTPQHGLRDTPTPVKTSCLLRSWHSRSALVLPVARGESSQQGTSMCYRGGGTDQWWS